MRSFPRGMSLMDVVVGSALVLIIFIGLFGIIRASIQIVGSAKQKAAATAIASSEIEYIRSLEYGSIGTVGGIPAGPIAQNATTTLNGIDYGVRVFIIYVDDEADGLGVADANSVITDYKRIKVSVTYLSQGQAREVVLVSNQAPIGVESTVPGGTLRIEVVDAEGLIVSGAAVRVENDDTAPTIDVTTFSDASGTVLLSGAPPSTEYNITVSKAGYSSAQTYERDATNQSPNPGPLTVALDQTTTAIFAIDEMSTLTLRTFSPIAPAVFFDPFDDTGSFSSFVNTVVTASTLSLSGTPGTYPGSGTALSESVTPDYLSEWTSASSTSVAPAQTQARIQIADGSGTPLPDADVPGNSAGFDGVIDLTSVSTTTYPSLSLIALLSSTDANVTPQLLDWELGYEEGPTPLPDVPFTLTGAKTIGSDGGGLSIFKTIISTSTNGEGIGNYSLEWDLYSFELSGFTIVASSTPPPFELFPDATLGVDLILAP